MRITRHISDLLSSNTYLIEEGLNCIVVDPFRDVSIAEELVVDYILLTHEHYDHISGVTAWQKEHPDARVICSASCADGIVDPKKNMARYFPAFRTMQTWIKVERESQIDFNYSCEADIAFREEMVLRWQGHSFNLFALPGHSKGSIGIILDGDTLFSGDSILPGMEIECGFPGGSKDDWNRTSSPKIETLPRPLKVYPGHLEDFILK